jgi:hypothetical protein
MVVPNMHKVLLDFVLLMAAGEDAHSPGAIRVLETVSFVLRKFVWNVSVLAIH